MLKKKLQILTSRQNKWYILKVYFLLYKVSYQIVLNELSSFSFKGVFRTQWKTLDRNLCKIVNGLKVLTILHKFWYAVFHWVLNTSLNENEESSFKIILQKVAFRCLTGSWICFYLCQKQSLCKIPSFYQISWCGDFVTRHSFCIVSGDLDKTMQKLWFRYCPFGKSSTIANFRWQLFIYLLLCAGNGFSASAWMISVRSTDCSFLNKPSIFQNFRW